MTGEHGFSVEVSQNKYLSIEDEEMDAVLVVTAGGAAAEDGVPELAEVITIDCSGSMYYPPTKLAAAQRATRTAIDVLRDGTHFAVVQGNERARMVYPETPELVVVTPETRLAAKSAVAEVRANGATAIGEWLRLARQLLDARPAAVRHVTLLTDGRNNQGMDVLEHELRACAPVFTCDSRGIGEDWEPRELLRIAEALHGSADAARELNALADEFEAMVQAAMDKLFPEVRITVSTTSLAEVDFLRQTFPTESQLEGDADGPRGIAFATGSWGAEQREFHLRLRVDPADAELDQDIRLARVDLRLRRPGATEFENPCAPALVLGHWTQDLTLSSIIDPKVAHHTKQTELGKAIMRGCDAHDRSDTAAATAEWGHAVALATRLGNDKVLTRLLRLVEVVGEPADGVVRIKQDVRAVDLLSAAMGSVVSSMSPDAAPASAPTPAVLDPEVSCPTCHKNWPAGSDFCGACGERLR
ncbi:VWA domain-containing protein [Actinophytocola sp.]|uniref:VWA domain-containing protein n=1 Tax=Actinophytocola sp. TaxID=1872138 RepID=UPI00389A2AD3